MYKFPVRPALFLRPVFFILLSCTVLIVSPTIAQRKAPHATRSGKSSSKRAIYGLASFYADRFNGKRTANGEIFSQRKLTCACNMLPFGTWIKVTNMKNGRSALVKVNDRLHTRMRRILDLSKSAAKKIGSTTSGLVRVRVEVIGKVKPA